MLETLPLAETVLLVIEQSGMKPVTVEWKPTIHGGQYPTTKFEWDPE